MTDYCDFELENVLFVVECVAVVFLTAASAMVCYLTREIYMIQRYQLPK